MDTASSLQHTTNHAAPYDNNPFTSALAAVKKLFAQNANTIAGFIAVSIVALLVIGATVIAMGLTGLAFLQQHSWSPDWIGAGGTAQLNTFSGPVNDLSIYATWLIGIPLIVLIGVCLQILAIKIGLVSSEGKQVGIGTAARQGIRRVLPAIGLALLVIAALIVPAAILALLTQFLGPIGVVLILIAVIIFLYIALRCAYAWLSLVDGRGPLRALQESWELTDGHFVETVGTLATGAAAVSTPLLVADALAALSGGIVGSIFSLLALLISVTGMIVVATILAERFQQLRAVRAGKMKAGTASGYNYLAVAILIVVLWLNGATQQTMQPTQPCGASLQTLSTQCAAPLQSY